MKRYTFFIFVIIAIGQLLVLASMIFKKESILHTGKEYKFEIAPVDPYDAFRGRYVILNFKASQAPAVVRDSIRMSEVVYVTLTEDVSGFAQPKLVSRSKPAKDFVKAIAGYSYQKDTIDIDYEFNRFYMEESKAADTEALYRKATRDSTQKSYAIVAIQDGEAVLKDIVLAGKPVKQLIEEARRQHKP
jgi:uncharacterized membrane-anchored protein